jgi:hypothetical protein
MSRRRLWVLGLVLLAVAGLALGVAVVLRWFTGGLPAPGSEPYERMVSAFYAGVAALDTDANTIARDALTRATKLVPAEPAAWADLALAEIRLGDLESAPPRLARAQSLAPESAAIEALYALLEQRRGRFAEALAHFRRAIELDPEDLRWRYELVQELERQGGDDAEALGSLKDLLRVAPENLAARLELARLAAKSGDSAALDEVVRGLREASASWPPQVQQQYQALEQSIGAGNPRLVATRVVVLRNVLLTVPEFRRSIEALSLPTGTVGEPLRQFLRLVPPPRTPAPPDESLAFEVGPLGGDATRQVGAVFLLPDPGGGPDIPLEADGRELRKADDPGAIAPFPGGPEAVPPSPAGIAVADWDSDYRPDLVLAGAGGLRILRQQDGGTFEDVPAGERWPAEAREVEAFGAWPADIDLDGDLDFVVGLRAGPTLLLRNGGDGTFEAARDFESVSALRGFAWADLDKDGDPDAAFLDAQGGLTVLDNERSGRFHARPSPEGLTPVEALAVADLDGDGAMDLVLASRDGIFRLSDRDEGGAWRLEEVARRSSGAAAEAARTSVGEGVLLAADLDNNGGVDLVAEGPTGARVWLDDGRGGLLALDDEPAIRAWAAADLDGDGRLDLAGLSAEGKPLRALGRGTKDYRWQVIRPRAASAAGDGRINSFGVGGEVQVRAGLLVQTQLIAGPAVHFGLGTHEASDVARVVWPNGTTQAEFDTKADRAIVAEQRLKGSCPFVYAFDGSAVRFVTDFLWRSPLGLRINAQDTAGVGQTEDWIKIRGDQLAPRDGSYDVRVAAELWETHYWDHVALMVVDHPEDTEIFVDERFARTPPALAVHATGRPRPVATARDDRGRDVTEFVRSRDGRYLDTFGRGSYQGVTRDHWVEVEIGEETPEGRGLVLVAEGWIHPTDSSLNVALGQGSHEPPRGLSLEVATAEGEWVVARDDLGFPAGKNKTILVDLDGVFRPGAPRRLRLRTNLEVYWDALSVATAEDAGRLRTNRIMPASAELRPRGYSLMSRADESSPEVPRYDRLTGTSQRWNDLIGLYTRFGDVLALLERVDDRYVIANAGDELALRFPAPGPPPPGWRRDFVLIGDGWNKDGDYNTAFSKTVLPLPSHARPAYDTPPVDLTDDPVYREHPGDWELYHTRFVTPRAFRDGLRPRPVASP